MMGDEGEKKKGRSVRSREGRNVWVWLIRWMDGKYYTRLGLLPGYLAGCDGQLITNKGMDCYVEQVDKAEINI